LEIRILRRLHSGLGRGKRNYDETEKPIPNANVSRFFGKNNKKWGKKEQKTCEMHIFAVGNVL
jgi:hypothetical protein